MTTSPSWYLEITISQARIRWAFLRERTISPVSSSIPSSRTSTRLARLGRRLVFPLVQRDQPLGLVADVDDDLVAHDLDDLARDDGPDLEALALAQEMVEGLGSVFRGHDRRQFVVADIKLTKQVTIYHVSDSFQFRPCPPRQGGLVGQDAGAKRAGGRRVRSLPGLGQDRTISAQPRSDKPGKKKNHPSTQGVDLRKQYYKSCPPKTIAIRRELFTRARFPLPISRLPRP